MSNVSAASGLSISDEGVVLGPEAERLDRQLAAAPMGLGPDTRATIWVSASNILSRGPLGSQDGSASTGLALGYVQSGKTTAITALVALAADAGYRVVVALLGTTNLLLEQNTQRIESALGIGERTDYRWVSLPNPRTRKGADALADWLERGRVVFVPVLKHAGRLRDLADVLEWSGAGRFPTLVVDDEADQASLNTKVKKEDESETYAAISQVRRVVPQHLYVQYTATPYAPLLLEPDDSLRPEFVEMLHPGTGYTGGREFFVDHADQVVRPIPTADEQAPRGLPTRLPGSLVSALANFVAGTAMLLGQSIENAPVSMLVHSTHKNDVQARYQFLVERALRRWRRLADEAVEVENLPTEVRGERARLVAVGAVDLPDPQFLALVRFVLREATVWLVNSVSAVKKIDWRVAPVHILIGGNKLDRGFTVEGLTVTYMNRPTSPQVDTVEQRARAFGYRQDLLPYCQFFAGPRTLEALRGVVFTEYDLRAELEDWLEAGKSVADWARRIGVMVPAGTKPTRDAVLSAVSQFNEPAGRWHSLRRPALDAGARAHNRGLVERFGLLSAEPEYFGRLEHRTLRDLRAHDVLTEVVEPWARSSYSPGWRHDDIVQYLRRVEEAPAVAVLLEQPEGQPRERKWDPELGFVNLFQGADVRPRPGEPFYPGDRKLFGGEEEDLIVLQVHRVHPRGMDDVPEVLTLAIRLGKSSVVRRA